MPARPARLPMPSTRKFGVEIEFVGISQTRMFEVLRDAGIPVNGPDSYHSSSRTRWVVKDDGSVHGRGGGGELVSPPISGAAGIRMVERVCRLIAEAGATANNSCGLHVHVDAAGLSSGEIANLVTLYTTYQDRINQVLPPSRRNSSYANPMDQTTVRSIVADLRERNTTNRTEIRRIIQDHDLSRYYALNLDAYLCHGTVEFRQHSGSTNWRKITNWIRFCLSMVEKARRMPATASVAPQTRRRTATATRSGRRGNFDYTARRSVWTQFRTGMFDVHGLASRIGHSVGTTRRWVNNLLAIGAIREDRTATGCYVRNQRMRINQIPALREWLGLRDGEDLPSVPRRRAVSTRPARVAATPALENTPAALFQGMNAQLYAYYQRRAQAFGFSWNAS